MTQKTRPDSIDELIAFLVSVVESHFAKSGKGADGAFLAEKIRHHYPDFRYEQLQLTKLADLVARGEAEGLIVRNRQVMHLEVLPAGPDKSGIAIGAQSGWVGTPHVRPDIWRAFVFVSHGQRYLYDRETQNVLGEASVGHAETGQRYIAIPSIPLVEQQRWMKDFLAGRTKLDGSAAPIDDAYCFTKFPIWLEQQETGLDRSWKQFRVHRVAEVIRRWSADNSLDPAAFFSAPLIPRASQHRKTLHDDDQIVRSALVAAARDLPIAQLREIAIPIRYVLDAVSKH